MERQWYFAGVGVVLAGTVLIQTAGFSHAATLDGFEIKTTGPNGVNVVLHTDSKAQVEAEGGDKGGYTIRLLNTQLSEAQIKNGLPVVIDDKNRFIARAVPVGKDQVKIIIPNLPSQNFKVTVSQAISQKKPVAVASKPSASIPSKSEHQKAVEALKKDALKKNALKKDVKPAIAKPVISVKPQPKKETPKPQVASAPAKSAIKPVDLKPRSPIAHAPASNFQKAAAQLASKNEISEPKAMLAATLPVKPATISASSGTKTKWRLVPPTPKTESRPEPAPAPVAPEVQGVPTGAATSAWNPYTSTLSLEQPSEVPPVPTFTPGGGIVHLPPDKALDPAQLASQGAGAVLPPLAPVLSLLNAQNGPNLEQTPAPPSRGFAQEIRDVFKGIPFWAYVMIGLFFGGIGFFTLIGGFVLVRILFSPVLPNHGAVPAISTRTGAQDLRERLADIQSQLQADQATETISSLPPLNLTFKDTVGVQASDLLGKPPSSMKEAVENTLMLKFPRATATLPQAAQKAPQRNAQKQASAFSRALPSLVSKTGASAVSRPSRRSAP